MTTDLMTMDLLSPVNSLDAYIFRVNQVPLLTADEELEYAKNLRENNDLESAKRLVYAHLRYVVRIARGYMGYGLALGDLIQEGNIGLMKAVRRFDPDIGVRLVSFAVHWIKSEIHEFVLRNWRIVKVATTKAQRKLFFNLRKMKKRLGWFSHEEVQQVANDLGVSCKEVLTMESRLNGLDVSFELPNDADEENSFVPAQYLAGPESDPASLFERAAEQTFNHQALSRAVESLDDRSREILEARWLGEEKQTLKDLAEKFQISAERIRQLENAAMSKLKAQLLDS